MQIKVVHMWFEYSSKQKILPRDQLMCVRSGIRVGMQSAAQVNIDCSFLTGKRKSSKIPIIGSYDTYLCTLRSVFCCLHPTNSLLSTSLVLLQYTISTLNSIKAFLPWEFSSYT